MNYHDTHFHFDLWEDSQNIVDKIEESKIYTIAVTNSPSVFFFTKQIADKCKYIRAAIGLHPELVASRKNELPQFLELLSQTRYVGEIGLDNSNKSDEDFSTQVSVFEKIIESCSLAKNKILTVHSRRASSEVISIIGANFPGKVILHWYSGNIRDMERALEYGFYFSINYPMTQSNSGRSLIDRLPIDRILIESDGPFTKYKGRSCSPLSSKEILSEIVLLKSKKDKISDSDILNNFELLIRDEQIQF